MRFRDPFCIIVRYCNFSIFKMAAVCQLIILKLKVLTVSHFRYTFGVTLLNFVEIGHTVAEISQFFVFVRLSRSIWCNFVRVRDNRINLAILRRYERTIGV